MNRYRWRAFLGGCLLLGALLPLSTRAAERAEAVVEALQMPAWIERQGLRRPLLPGQLLGNQDRLLTGPDAGVRIRLADGSVLALGGDSELRLHALGVRGRQVFTAAVDVPRGSLRFSSGSGNTAYRQRAINLRFGTITAGVRGTDLWGSADAQGDRICLLEGAISVHHADDEARQLSEPSSCYLATKGAPPTLADAASPGELGMRAALTGVHAGSGETTRRGRWLLELSLVDSESGALALYDHLRAAGYAARIMPQAASGGGYHFSVRILQLASKADAEALAARLERSLGLASPQAVRR